MIDDLISELNCGRQFKSSGISVRRSRSGQIVNRKSKIINPIWVHSKNAARQKSTSTNGARSCVCIVTRSAPGRSRFPFCPEMRLLFNAFTDAKGCRATSFSRSKAFVFAQAPGRVFISRWQCLLPMKHRFNKHYTRDEARALLPQIRNGWSGSTSFARIWNAMKSAWAR